MNLKSEKVENTGKYDILKWIVTAILILAGFVANYYFSQYPWPIRAVGWLILVCLVVAIALQTEKGKQAWKFFKDARNEMRKVVWPTRQQTFQTTLMIIAVSVIFAIVMWGIDSVLMWAVNWLTGQRG